MDNIPTNNGDIQINNIGMQPNIDNNRANRISLLSLLFAIIPRVLVLLLMVVSAVLNDRIGINNNISDLFEVIIGFAEGLKELCSIAAVVLMIYVRVQYPKNLFAKIIMWIYIVYIIIIVIIVAFVFIACGYTLYTCSKITAFIGVANYLW